MALAFRKRFPVDRLQPRGGELAGAIACNSMAHSPLALAHDIVVDLAPFTLARRVQDTAVALRAVPLAVRSWRALAGRSIACPPPPDLPAHLDDGSPVRRPGEPHGSIQLLGQHVAVRATRIAFGPLAAGAIPAELALTLALAELGYGTIELTLPVTLRLGGIRILGDIARVARPPADEAYAIAGRFLDLRDYEPRQIDGVVTYCPSGAGG